MLDAIKHFITFAMHPTSERASIVCIVLSQWMTVKDCRDFGDYFKELAISKKRDGEP